MWIDPPLCTADGRRYAAPGFSEDPWIAFVLQHFSRSS